MRKMLLVSALFACWAAWTTTAARAFDPCDEYSDCAGSSLVCVDEICQSCDADPDQCEGDGRVCDGDYCVPPFECDPYDMWNLDCHPETCDPGTLMCGFCDNNPQQCPPTTFCDNGYYCAPIGKQ